jgi:acyl-homoserine lactone acylase PvdQ
MLDAVGQSGHVLSPRYSDALRDWSTGQARAMRMDRAAAERNAIGTLRLTPASAAGSR